MKKYFILLLAVIPVTFLFSKPIGCQAKASPAFEKHSVKRFADLPKQVREKISHQLQTANYELDSYKQILPSGEISKYRAYNRNQSMIAYFTEKGAYLLSSNGQAPSWSLEMQLSAYGYKDVMAQIQPVQPDEIYISGQRVEYVRDNLTEWFVNDERGLEHGVVLSGPPKGNNSGPIIVEWTVFGSLFPSKKQQSDEIVFYSAEGHTVLNYNGLKVWDASGRVLPASMTLLNDGIEGKPSRISIAVDDTGASYPVTIDPLFSQTKITASDSADGDYFGCSVSISGDTAIVGAFEDEDNGDYSGSAYIFSRNQGGPDNWGQVQKLLPSDGDSSDRFGRSVSISGDTAIVGAYEDEDNGYESGSAYIFSRDQGGTDNWGQVQKLLASDAYADIRDYFGYSVSISGDTAIVGAYGYGFIFSDYSGSVYIFSRDQGGTDNWGQVKRFGASDPAAQDFFGISVALSGDTAIVGSRQDDDNGNNSGSAYIFSRDQGGADNWGQVQKLLPSDGAEEDYFGESVSLSSDTAIVGSRQDDDNGSYSGSAYIFSRDQGGTDNWGQVQKLLASDGAAEDYFGTSVAISGDTAIVGSRQDDDNGSNSGSAYIFSRNQGGADNWGQINKLLPSDGAEYDQFGQKVSITGDTVLVGTYRYANGSAYVFIPGMNAMPWLPLLLLVDDSCVSEPATGSIITVPEQDLVDGETFTINDGVGTTITFEFEINGNGVLPGNTPLMINTGDNANTVSDAISAGINAMGGGGFMVFASTGDTALVLLENAAEGTHGNQPITETVANGNFVVEGMSGGCD